MNNKSGRYTKTAINRDEKHLRNAKSLLVENSEFNDPDIEIQFHPEYGEHSINSQYDLEQIFRRGMELDSIEVVAEKISQKLNDSSGSLKYLHMLLNEKTAKDDVRCVILIIDVFWKRKQFTNETEVTEEAELLIPILVEIVRETAFENENFEFLSLAFSVLLKLEEYRGIKPHEDLRGLAKRFTEVFASKKASDGLSACVEFLECH